MATCLQDEAIISAEINLEKKFPKWKMSINYCEYSQFNSSCDNFSKQEILTWTACPNWKQ